MADLLLKSAPEFPPVHLRMPDSWHGNPFLFSRLCLALSDILAALPADPVAASHIAGSLLTNSAGVPYISDASRIQTKASDTLPMRLQALRLLSFLPESCLSTLPASSHAVSAGLPASHIRPDSLFHSFAVLPGEDTVASGFPTG